MSSPHLRSPNLPAAESTSVPVSALVVSVLALVIAGAVNFLWPAVIPEYSALLWLLALIPPFLLAYYRGWKGAALALAAGMVLLIGVEVGGSLLTDRAIRWWIVGGVILVLILVSLGAGLLSEKQRRQTSEALHLAYADALTGLPNRRILDMFLWKGFAAAQRGASLAIVLFDIDGFKRYNDERGHSAGDEILRLVARVLNHDTRAEDLSGRLAGDEFLALLLGQGVEGAMCFADRICAGLKEARLARETGVTLSAGVAVFDPSMTTPEELLDAADRALYAAKNLGGDRVVVNAEKGEPALAAEPLERGWLLHPDGEVRSAG